MTCNEKTEVYSRVVGYFRPVANWNKGKREEFQKRMTYRVAEEKKNAPVIADQEVKFNKYSQND